MKTGTHNLGSNAFAARTLVRVKPGVITLRQFAPGAQGSQEITLSADQVAMLKELLA